MITALVVMYNAEMYLHSHFKSIRFCDEIIAIDLGSKDRSIDIAKEYGCKIEHHPWVPMGELAWCNYVHKAKNDWIFIADPDEVVTPALVNKIVCMLQNVPDDVGTISLPYRHHFMGKRVMQSIWKDLHYLAKIFHRSRVELLCDVHRPIVIKPRFKDIKLITQKDDDTEVVLHYPAENFIYLLQKLFRYSLLEGKAKFNRGEVATIKNFIKSIALSIYYNYRYHNGLHTLTSATISTLFVMYDVVAQFMLWLYQHRYYLHGIDVLQIEPTRRCNMHCRHCIRYSMQDLKNSGYISLDTFRSILDKHRDVRVVKLQGLGEPLMHPNIDLLIQEIRSRGHRVMIITNGSLPIPPDIDDLVVSLETLDHERYYRVRGYNLDKVLKNIIDASRYCKVTINCVLTHETTPDDVMAIEKFAASIGAEMWKTPMEVWVDERHPHYDEAHANARNAAIIHNVSIDTNRKKRCQWMTRNRYYDYLGREHPCCIRMTDEYLLSNMSIKDKELCCKNCPF